MMITIQYAEITMSFSSNYNEWTIHLFQNELDLQF